MPALDVSPHPVLVVEDLDDDFLTVAEVAHRAGIPNPLVRAETLGAARRAVERGTDPFSFVLLDLNLPDGPGADLVRALRASEARRALPVIVFTTSDNPRDLREVYTAGANAYHAKALRHVQNVRTLEEIFAYWLSAALLPPA